MKISIVVPTHHTESITHITNTLEGIKRTIGIEPYEYTVITVGTLPSNYIEPQLDLIKSHIPTDLMLGDAKNLGADFSTDTFNPDILVFMDAHTNFFDKESKDWGIIVSDYLNRNPDHIVAPAISLYDKPSQRGYGVISEVTDDNMNFDLKWKWWGDAKNNEPFEIPGLCGCFMAMTPKTFNDSICGFTPPLAIDDREFSIRMWTLGKTMICLPSITVGHRFSSGYTYFTKKRSIEWGMGMLLYTYLNMDDGVTKKLYDKGIHATQDKRESCVLATDYYWRNIKRILERKRVRTSDQYFLYFKQ